MMEGNSNQNHPDGCKCGVCANGMNGGMNKGGCGGQCGACGCHGKFHGFFIIRMIMAILLAIVIFWTGFMLGELHTFNWFNFHGANVGYGMMGNFGGGSTLRVYHNNTMNLPPADSAAPSTPATK